MRDPEMPKLPPVPTGFKVWFAICAAVSLAVIGVLLWAVIAVVNHYT